MSWTRVLQSQVSATVTVVQPYTTGEGRHVRVRGLTIVTLGTGGGDVKLSDATTSATVRITEAVPAAANAAWSIYIPAAGVWFKNGLVVTVPTSVKVGVYYDG